MDLSCLVFDGIGCHCRRWLPGYSTVVGVLSSFLVCLALNFLVVVVLLMTSYQYNGTTKKEKEKINGTNHQPKKLYVQ